MRCAARVRANAALRANMFVCHAAFATLLDTVTSLMMLARCYAAWRCQIEEAIVESAKQAIVNCGYIEHAG